MNKTFKELSKGCPLFLFPGFCPSLKKFLGCYEKYCVGWHFYSKTHPPLPPVKPSEPRIK